ncbi:MAG: hypothetical protein LBO03_06380 [Acidaminococcales bacterium]|jgi:hypothetical protein|nr:hypothetical protein [Acidaminococcales bacterium]
MLKTSQFKTGEGLHKVAAMVTLCGKDVAVTIGGGDTPHVGAAALASPRPSLKKDGSVSASASVLCVMGHKDDMPARTAALRLASELNVNVAVSVGLHIDDATEKDFTAIQSNFDALIDLIVRKLKYGG